MKEIGGYFELEQYVNGEYYPDAIAVNTARNALAYLVKAKKISKIYIPYYLCDSIYKVCERENIQYEFYNINSEFLPKFDKKLASDEYLYVVNYFGQLSQDDVIKLKEEHKNIILDNVQAFFTPPVDNVDTIYSCRKFFGVPDGAYLVSDAKQLTLDTDRSSERVKHLLGRLEANATDYYKDFLNNDSMFEILPIRYMSLLTYNILRGINYTFVKERRNKNWDFLNNYLGKVNGISLIKPEAPYMYPLYLENGMFIRKKLIEDKIFVPVLWPNVLDFNGCELEKDYAVNIVPLPIDQRYNSSVMKIIVDKILNFKK